MGERDILDRTFGFALGIVKLCKDCERSAVSRALIGQLLRAATSVGANVEEAQAGQSRADFLSKMSIACKESREANYWLRLLVASDLIASPHALLDESAQLVAILTAIVKRTKEKRGRVVDGEM